MVIYVEFYGENSSVGIKFHNITFLWILYDKRRNRTNAKE